MNLHSNTLCKNIKQAEKMLDQAIFQLRKELSNTKDVMFEHNRHHDTIQIPVDLSFTFEKRGPFYRIKWERVGTIHNIHDVIDQTTPPEIILRCIESLIKNYGIGLQTWKHILEPQIHTLQASYENFVAIASKLDSILDETCTFLLGHRKEMPPRIERIVDSVHFDDGFSSKRIGPSNTYISHKTSIQEKIEFLRYFYQNFA